METIAVYWEPVIRVYGFDIRKNVAVLELDFQLEAADYWGECIEALAGSGAGFIMAMIQCVDHATARSCIGVKQDYAAACRQILEDGSKKGYTVTIRLRQPVDILFFHGPHFQDRYGIAEAAFRNLDRQRITLHTACCTGTSVYMVVNDGEAELARDMLAKGFKVPGHDNTPGTE